MGKCLQCEMTIDGEGMAFCPYCGAKLAETACKAEPVNEEAEKWIRKALAATSFPERKKILQKGLEKCPDSRDIAFELLFIGEQEKYRRSIDFSLIKSWVLEIYRKPEELPEEKRDRMRAQLYDAPELKECLARFEDPAEKQREYIQRLCTEYVELFLEGNNQVMGNIFGFHIGRDKEKRLARPVADMIARIRADEKLLPEQREQLWKAMYQAYASRANGKTGYLDELIK